MKNPNTAAPIVMYNTLNLMEQNAIKITRAKNNLAEARKELAQKQLLREFYISKEKSGFVITKPWTQNQSLDAFLTSLTKKNPRSAIAFDLASNPHGFEIDTTQGDRLWIYHNNEIWSSGIAKSFGYVYKGDGKFTIYNEPGADKYLETQGKGSGFECGSLVYKNNKWKFVVTAENQKPGYGDVEQKNSLWDGIQTILDIAGFIPIYGDFIDAVNALIYFIRGKWFDGILSLLAIIPIIGSFIKVGVKSIYKGTKAIELTKKIQKAWAGKDATKVFQDLILNGAIHPGNFHLLGTGIDKLNDMIKSGNRFAKSIPGIKKYDDVLQQLDDLEVFMKSANISSISKNADDMASMGAAVVRGGKKVPVGHLGVGAKELIQAEKVARLSAKGLARGITLNIVPLFKSFSTLNPKALKNLDRALDTRFIRELANPDKLAAVIKTTTNRFQMARIDDILIKQWGVNSSYIASDLAAALRAANPGQLTALANDIGNVIVKSPGTHVMHNAYKNDTLVNLKAYTSKDIKDPVGRWGRNFNFEYKKNIDIIWNEIHDAGEDLNMEIRPGVDDSTNKYDEADGLVWPLVKKMYATVIGKKNYDSQTELANSMLNNPMFRAIIDRTSDKSKIAYDVKLAKGGDYE